MSNLTTLLETERSRLETEQAELQEQVRMGAERLARVRTRLEHILALLGQESEAKTYKGGPQTSPNPSNSTTSTICDIAVEILSERKAEPMYYKELAEEVIRRGGILNGVTPWATLTARMVQDERFVRPTAKGFYALRRDYPTARNVGARVKSGRRRRGSQV